jgi:hypothetical protein
MLLERLLNAEEKVFDALVDVIDDFRTDPWEPVQFDDLRDLPHLHEWMNVIEEVMGRTKALHELLGAVICECSDSDPDTLFLAYRREGGYRPLDEIEDAERLFAVMEGEPKDAETETLNAWGRHGYDVMLFVEALNRKKKEKAKKAGGK